MSTRFDADDSAELWVHLNALDDDSVKFYLTTAERDGDPDRPRIAVVGSGVAMQITAWDGTAWRTLHGSLNNGPEFFTPVAGITVAAFAAEVSGRAITWQMSLSGMPAVGAGANNILLGTVAAGYRPRVGFASWQGWLSGGSPLMTGLCASNGAVGIRWSHAAVSAGLNNTWLAGSWPI